MAFCLSVLNKMLLVLSRFPCLVLCFTWSRSLLVSVPRVSRALRTLVPHVSRALRDPVHYILRALRALVSHVPRAFVLDMYRALHAFLPHVLSALRAVVSHVSCLVSYALLYRTLRAFVLLFPYLLQVFQA